MLADSCARSESEPTRTPGERRARALHLQHELVRRLGQDGARALRRREARVQTVGGVAMRRERVPLDAPALVADLMAVGDASAEGGALRALPASAQHHVPAHQDRLRTAALGLAEEREHATLEATLDGQRSRERRATLLGQHSEAELLDEGVLRGRKQRSEVGAFEHRDRVRDLARGMIGGEHEQLALARRERRGERAQQGCVARGVRLARGERRDSETARHQPARAGARADQEGAATQDQAGSDDPRRSVKKRDCRAWRVLVAGAD